MNWEALGSISEFVAAVGVIGSLFYLGYQLRLNRLSEKQQIIDANYLIFNELRQSLYENEDVARIYLTGMDNPEALNDIETFRYMAISETFFQNGEAFWRQLGGTTQTQDSMSYLIFLVITSKPQVAKLSGSILNREI
jgi:hypothetical protein